MSELEVRISHNYNLNYMGFWNKWFTDIIYWNLIAKINVNIYNELQELRETQ